MKKFTVDGNTAAAHGAYAFSEFAAVYPITPSSSMSERFDEWSSSGRQNLFGSPVKVFPMQKMLFYKNYFDKEDIPGLEEHIREKEIITLKSFGLK